MLRIPTYSLALLAIGIVIGAIAGSERLAYALGGAGSLIGYVIWMRARVKAIQAGMAFHLGSVVATILCTVVAIGVGVVGLGGNDAMANNEFWLVTLPASAFAVWLQWRTAQQSRTTRLLPTAGEVGREVLRTVFAEEAGPAALGAIVEIGADAAKKAKHVGSHPGPNQ